MNILIILIKLSLYFYFKRRKELSQYRFTHENKSVLFGFDEPLKCCFLVIENKDDPDADPLYSNLNQNNWKLDFADIINVLSDFDIEAPANLFLALLKDIENHDPNYSNMGVDILKDIGIYKGN